MRGDWRSSTWGEEISLEYGKALRDYSRSKGKFRVFGSNGAIGWTDDPIVAGPGIILGRKGAYRGIQYCADPFFVIDTAYYVVPKTDLDMRWLYYAMKHYRLGDVDDGSPIPSTTRAAVYVMKLDVPPKSEQLRVSQTLGTLDDKIELNRRMNETLEAIAQAIFKSWFVDFGPVRAKAEGRQPEGMDAETAALFPSSFVESPLGPVPKGWKPSTFGYVAENVRRGVSADVVAPTVPYFGLEHMPRKCIALSEWGYGNEVISNKSAFKKGEFLFGKLRPYFHKVGVAPVDGICSTDILVVRPKEDDWYGLVLGHISSSEFVDHTDRCSAGTKMPRTNWSDMAKYPVVLPDPKIAACFSNVIIPMVERIITNVHESRTLAETRDVLLPKLLSGQLRVSEISLQSGWRSK